MSPGSIGKVDEPPIRTHPGKQAQRAVANPNTLVRLTSNSCRGVDIGCWARVWHKGDQALRAVSSAQGSNKHNTLTNTAHQHVSTVCV
eukprot:scaffold157457_cov21-Tisochrysis_lutea.AAC.1